jgi:hypothetical protein
MMNNEFKKSFPLFLLLILFLFSAARAEEKRIDPAWPVPDYVEHLIQVASEEIGYTEDHGYTKYGEWAGDPQAQWCAEFQCWCVDQVDRRWGPSLLRNVYPFYTSSNTGRRWFIRAGRYVIRKGQVEDWGYEWLKGQNTFIRSGDYIPQPGDWVFFNWGGGTDTEHVALVEYCTRDESGRVLVHVIEGNNVTKPAPQGVERNDYAIDYWRILGYGTVYDLADMTLKFGHSGPKVTELQKELVQAGLLEERYTTGKYGAITTDCVKAVQRRAGIQETGIANLETRMALRRMIEGPADE